MGIEAKPKSPNATLEQAAEYLQVNWRTVQNYQNRGVLKTVYLGRRRFFTWDSVERLAKTGTGVAKEARQ